MIHLSIDPKNVKSAYNGKAGCMCGCLGDYAYTQDNAEAAGKSRGYPVGCEEISDRKVTSRIKKIKDMLSEGNFDELDINIEGGYIHVQNGERVTAIYFID